MPGLVILQIKRRVYKREIGEQTLCAALATELEQVVVGVAGVVVYPLFHLEYLYREYGRFAVAESRLGCFQKIFHEHSALARRVRSVVYGRKRNLCARAGVHGV